MYYSYGGTRFIMTQIEPAIKFYRLAMAGIMLLLLIGYADNGLHVRGDWLREWGTWSLF